MEITLSEKVESTSMLIDKNEGSTNPEANYEAYILNTTVRFNISHMTTLTLKGDGTSIRVSLQEPAFYSNDTPFTIELPCEVMEDLIKYYTQYKEKHQG